MIFSILFLLLYIIIFSCFKEKTYYYIYNIGVLLFGVLLCAKFDSASSALIYHIFAIGMFLPIIPYLGKYINFIITSIAILIIYIVFKYIIWHIDVIRMFMDLRISIFAVCMCLAMIEDIARGRLNTKLLIKGMYVLVATQIVLAIFQYFIPSLSNFFLAIDSESGADALDKAVKLNMTLLTGSLMSPSALSGFLVISIFVLLVYELESHSLTINKSLFILLAIAVTFFTGIRTPFVFFVLFSALYFFLYQRKMFLSLMPVFALIIIALVTSVTIGREGAVGRMFDGFNQAFTGMEGLEETTLGLTFVMIPYFLQNPLFGLSLGADGYIIIGMYALSDISTSDVYLLFMLCEYGLVGLLLFLYPFFKIKKMTLKTRFQTPITIKQTTILMYVAYGVCLAIVDKGIFNYLTVVLLITGIVMFSYNKGNAASAPLEIKRKDSCKA